MIFKRQNLAGLTAGEMVNTMVLILWIYLSYFDARRFLFLGTTPFDRDLRLPRAIMWVNTHVNVWERWNVRKSTISWKKKLRNATKVRMVLVLGFCHDSDPVLRRDVGDGNVTVKTGKFMYHHLNLVQFLMYNPKVLQLFSTVMYFLQLIFNSCGGCAVLWHHPSLLFHQRHC